MKTRLAAALAASVLSLPAFAQADPTPPTWTYVDHRDSETHSTIYHPAALDAFRQLYAIPPYEYGALTCYLTEDPDD